MDIKVYTGTKTQTIGMTEDQKVDEWKFMHRTLLDNILSLTVYTFLCFYTDIIIDGAAGDANILDISCDLR